MRVWGGNGRFDHETVGTAKLFHVEQFEIGRNDKGFRCFLTAKKRWRRSLFTVLRTVITVDFHRDGGRPLQVT